MAIFSVNHSTIGRSTHAAGTGGAHLGYITRAGACRLVMGANMPIPKAGTKGGAARSWLDEQEAGDRKNARVIDKLRLSLPIELDDKQRETLVRQFVADLGGAEVPWMAAIHDQGKDAQNPHAHLVVRDRHIETGKRALGMSEKGSTERVRKLWETAANRALEEAGRDERIDRRTLVAQRAEKLELAEKWQDTEPELAAAYEATAATLDRRPQASAGPIPRAIEARGKRSSVLRRIRRFEQGGVVERLRGLFRPRMTPETPQSTRSATEALTAALRAFQRRLAYEEMQDEVLRRADAEVAADRARAAKGPSIEERFAQNREFEALKKRVAENDSLTSRPPPQNLNEPQPTFSAQPTGEPDEPEEPPKFRPSPSP